MTMSLPMTVPVSYRPEPGQTIRKGERFTMNVTPLARAALDNGVSFADVQAYVESRTRYTELAASAWYEAVNVPEVMPATPALAAHVTEMVTDTLLEGALLKSVIASGSLAAARLWWRGVL